MNNRSDIYQKINELLIARQSRGHYGESIPKTVNVANELSGADELKKYKLLLDDGIIFEEEFAAKKKQILGL
ncbi:MAG: SHOCT domain-containing protein [Lachnospiraceae bacterium]|nr:SHOCT domain-containing protein [Lachnospiraceae bacterium]